MKKTTNEALLSRTMHIDTGLTDVVGRIVCWWDARHKRHALGDIIA
jgi:hypothetical protein